MACVKLTTERIVSSRRSNRKKVPLWKSLKGLVKNKPLISILIGIFTIHDEYDACQCCKRLFI